MKHSQKSLFLKILKIFDVAEGRPICFSSLTIRHEEPGLLAL